MKRNVNTLCLTICMFTLVIAFAKPAMAVTQGEVAFTLAAYLGLDTSSSEKCIAALGEIGIIPEGGWNAGATVDAAFIGKLFTVVNRVAGLGTLHAPSNLNNASALTAATLTRSGIDSATVLSSIVAAGGNEAEAQKGIDAATSGRSFGTTGGGKKTSSVLYPDTTGPSGMGGGGGSATQSR